MFGRKKFSQNFSSQFAKIGLHFSKDLDGIKPLLCNADSQMGYVIYVVATNQFNIIICKNVSAKYKNNIVTQFGSIYLEFYHEDCFSSL